MFHVIVTCKHTSKPRVTTLFDWKMASTISCILCQKDTAPGNRVYLKSGQEPLESVTEVLITVPGRSKEEVEEFLSESVCCKAVCSTTLKKLARIRREMDDMKFDIENRIGSLYRSLKDEQADICTSLLSTPSSHAAVSRTRLVFNTPVKKTQSHPVDPSSSPVVYVSLYFSYNYNKSWFILFIIVSEQESRCTRPSKRCFKIIEKFGTVCR